MKRIRKNPAVKSLALSAEAAANAWRPYAGAEVFTDRKSMQVGIMTRIRGPIPAVANGIEATCFFRLEDLNELIGDLLAARADLVKLMRQKEDSNGY